ncbi:hypothetical protein H6G03_05830 [Planktothrix sp. FACHB-1375]|uniref:Uncharacterized protein n=3 Tax=Oscillatoriophycideae TaxID=1301283 RepID=A0A926VBA8_9CYAN|nr:hypothetical protein [Aerosakkonema funiforme FACHB-1375]
MQRQITIRSETKAMKDWIDWVLECVTYDDGTFDGGWLESCQNLWKQSRGDVALFAQRYVSKDLKSDGYHDFSESGFSFLDTFLKEGMRRVDWAYVGRYFVDKLGLK